MQRKTFLLLLTLCLIAAAGIQIWIFSSGYYSISSDESARTLHAYEWYRTKTVSTEVWLPMHAIILGYSLGVSKDLITTPRLVSLIFSLLSIAGLALLTHQLFKNKIITLTAVLLYIFLPERIILSAVPLAEIIFICFIIYGSAFLMKRINNKKSGDLLIASFFWAAAGALRYEGWIFSASILFYCFYEYRCRNLHLKYLLFISTILLSFPLYWVLMSYLQSGNFLGFLSSTSEMFKAKFGDSFLKGVYLNVFWQFLEQNYNSYNYIGLIGLFFIFSERKLSGWIIVCFSGLLLMGIVSALGKALPSHNFWRTPAVWTILLIPFTAYLLHELSHYLFLTKPVKIKLSSVIALLLLVQFSIVTVSKVKKMDSSYCLTEKNIEIGNSLHKILKYPTGEVYNIDRKNSEGLILIEKNRSFDHLNISVSTNNPDNFIYFENSESPLPPSRPEIKNRIPYINKIKKLNVSYLLFKSEEIKDYLDSRKEVKAIRTYGGWKLYKLI